MSQNIIEEVSKLNKKISQIATKRVSVEAESQIVMRNLKQSIVKYEQKYGVSLKGKTFDEISKLVHAEYDRVEAEVKSEYEMASKVVGLIEKGNVKEARAILEKARGTEDPVASKEVEEKEKVNAPESDPVVADEKAEEPVVEEEDFGEDDLGPDDFDEPILPDDVESSKAPSENKDSEQVGETEESEDREDDMGDVSEDDDYGFGQFLANEKAKAQEKVETAKTTPVKQAVEEMDDSFEKDDFSFDDDDDSTGDSFGFGQFLKGSKFEI